MKFVYEYRVLLSYFCLLLFTFVYKFSYFCFGVVCGLFGYEYKIILYLKNKITKKRCRFCTVVETPVIGRPTISSPVRFFFLLLVRQFRSRNSESY